MRLHSSDGRFFRYKKGGEIKNGRCVPSVLGEGNGILFRRCSLRSLAAAILGWRSGRAARGTKWRKSGAATRARPTAGGASQSRVGRGETFCESDPLFSQQRSFLWSRKGQRPGCAWPRVSWEQSDVNAEPVNLSGWSAGFVFGQNGMLLLQRKGLPGKSNRRCPSKLNLKLAKIGLWRCFPHGVVREKLAGNNLRRRFLCFVTSDPENHNVLVFFVYTS